MPTPPQVAALPRVPAQVTAQVTLPPPAQALPQVAAPPFDAQAETRKLADAVRGLAADRDQIISRLAAVEQDVHAMSDVTGSISKQIAAAGGTRRAESGPTVTATAAANIALAAVATTPTGLSTAPQAAADFGAPATPGAIRRRYRQRAHHRGAARALARDLRGAPAIVRRHGANRQRQGSRPWQPRGAAAGRRTDCTSRGRDYAPR